MRRTLLGTGTPAPSLERQSSGYLVEVGGETLVFDHGPGAHQRLMESGRRAVDVSRAFFTHLHYATSWTIPASCSSAGTWGPGGSRTL